MRAKPLPRNRFVGRWLLTLLAPAGVQLLLSLALADFGMFQSELTLFWLVVVAASGCVVTSTAVILRALRREEAELGYIGLFFFAVSVLPLVHGITTPGVLYGPNSASMAAVQWSIPTGLMLASPLLLPSGIRVHLAHRLWRRWTAIGIAATLALSGALLIETELLPVVSSRSFGAVILVISVLVGSTLLSRRHLYLAQVANSPLPLVVSIGFGFVGSSSLVWFGAAPFSAGFWVAHLLDITGVFAGSVGAFVVLRSTSRVRTAIEPILTTEPLAALELGIDPVVHRFVADLEAKDPMTRDHVIRTAELAVAIGTELGLAGRELRQVGLTGLLHDIGKLDIPDAILNKPERLTDNEYEVMKRHAAFGQAMVETSPALTDIGRYIRAHHERIDGDGYPDGRGGQAIPLVSRIVAVSDSFDAMANTRQYRDGMGADRAIAILREHAGSQWDSSVVDAAVRVVSRRPAANNRPAFDAVGRVGAPGTEHRAVGCDCIPTGVLLTAD